MIWINETVVLFFCSPGEFNSWLASLQECSKFILTGSEEHRTTISSKHIGWRKLRRGFWSSKSVDVIWTYIDCYLFLYNEMPIWCHMHTSIYIWESHHRSLKRVRWSLENCFLLWQMYLRRKTNGEETEIFYCQFLLIDASIDMYGFISLYLIWQGSLR